MTRIFLKELACYSLLHQKGTSFQRPSSFNWIWLSNIVYQLLCYHRLYPFLSLSFFFVSFWGICRYKTWISANNISRWNVGRFPSLNVLDSQSLMQFFDLLWETFVLTLGSIRQIGYYSSSCFTLVSACWWFKDFKSTKIFICYNHKHCKFEFAAARSVILVLLCFPLEHYSYFRWNVMFDGYL